MKVVLAEDHKIVRDGLRALLETCQGIEVVGEAADGRAAVALAREQRPDVVVMDVTMPMLNGVDATAQIRRDMPQTHVVALSMHSDRRFVSAMLAAGASGYLLKDCAVQDLAAALRTVAGGGLFLSPGLADAAGEDGPAPSTTDPDGRVHLSEREREVLQLLAEGVATRELANRLGVSVKTVETHRMHLMRKLNLHSVAALVKYAVREGITPP